MSMHRHLLVPQLRARLPHAKATAGNPHRHCKQSIRKNQYLGAPGGRVIHRQLQQKNNYSLRSQSSRNDSRSRFTMTFTRRAEEESFTSPSSAHRASTKSGALNERLPLSYIILFQLTRAFQYPPTLAWLPIDPSSWLRPRIGIHGLLLRKPKQYKHAFRASSTLLNPPSLRNWKNLTIRRIFRR